VSAEPLLGEISFEEIDNGETVLAPECWGDCACPPDPGCFKQGGDGKLTRRIDWVIVGGESGPGARPCEADWIRHIVEQCSDAGVACFVKQAGGNVFAPWKLTWSTAADGSRNLIDLDRTHGHSFATVWPNGIWHTWDANGVGGENSQEETVESAQSAAIDALARQHIEPVKGWARHPHMLKHRKGGDPSEWPEDLRVRQWPEARA
jgi:hypothetical protein